MLKTTKLLFNGKITRHDPPARYQFAKLIVGNKLELQKELSRTMGTGIRSNVIIKDLDIHAIYPTQDKLIIRTVSDGQIKVKVVM